MTTRLTDPNYDRKFAARFWSKVLFGTEDECWLWQGTMKHKGGRGNYGAIMYRKRVVLAHRMAYQLAVGEITNGLWVLHTCDTPLCCNPRHLYLGTPTQNQTDARVRGRDSVKRRLTDQEIVQILSDHDRGIASVVIAQEHGVHPNTISAVVGGKTWKHIPRTDNKGDSNDQ